MRKSIWKSFGKTIRPRGKCGKHPVFSNIFRNKSVLVTGHTGFKGSWLSLWLDRLGAKVSGLSLPPETSPSHWGLLDLDIDSHICNLRDADTTRQIIHRIQPDFIFHLAAQALVRPSYANPLETWSTNVMGGAHLLEACRDLDHLAGVLFVTTDKCYENTGHTAPYKEDDKLGGHDPYSASKAAAEMLAQSYRLSFFSTTDTPVLCTARGGNVIGGGDWSDDRLICDIIRAVANQTELRIRYPEAVRPWQHVLDCLSGYLCIAEHMLSRGNTGETGWNIGPDQNDALSVKQIVEKAREYFPDFTWEKDGDNILHEAGYLTLDSTRAHQQLDWRPVYNVDAALESTFHWYRSYLDKHRVISAQQLDDYSQKAADKHIRWATA